MRSLVPADSLVYLETNDLAAALQPIVDNEAFITVAKNKPDISALRGIQLAVTVTGFEMSEEKLTDEYSIGRVQPRFVAIADTHAWNWQAVAFAEINIGGFVMDIYRSDVAQEKTQKHGGTWFTWTAGDGRKAFALVIDGIIFFGTDESSIERCLAVKRGETDSIVSIGKVAQFDASTIASGYVSPDGVAQMASLAGLSMAANVEGEPEVRSAIADILPQLLRGAVSDIKWSTSLSTEGRVEDRFVITSPDEVARVFSETLTAAGQPDHLLLDMVPAQVPTVTLYNLSKPNVAWRSILLTSQTLVKSLPGGLIAEFAAAFAEPYALRDPELFLSGVGTSIVTGNIDPNGDKPLVIANIVIPENVRNSLDRELAPDKALSDEFAVEVLRTPDGDLAAAFPEGKVIAGNAEAVIACLSSRTERTVGQNPAAVQLLTTGATAATLAVDKEAAPAIASVLFQAEPQQVEFASSYSVDTRFSRAGVQRRTISDFGIIGWIIAQLAAG